MFDELTVQVPVQQTGISAEVHPQRENTPHSKLRVPICWHSGVSHWESVE